MRHISKHVGVEFILTGMFAYFYAMIGGAKHNQFLPLCTKMQKCIKIL